jgi:hypothetical protein
MRQNWHVTGDLYILFKSREAAGLKEVRDASISTVTACVVPSVAEFCPKFVLTMYVFAVYALCPTTSKTGA